MKKLQTTCYARTKNIDPSIPQVQTSRGSPHWWNAKIKSAEFDLAPNDEVFAMFRNHTGDWRAAYRRQIERLHAVGRLAPIIDRIPEGAILLCFEADHGQCHRKILADFLVEKGLADVSEMPWKSAAKQEPKSKSERKVFC